MAELDTNVTEYLPALCSRHNCAAAVVPSYIPVVDVFYQTVISDRRRFDDRAAPWLLGVAVNAAVEGGTTVDKICEPGHLLSEEMDIWKQKRRGMDIQEFGEVRFIHEEFILHFMLRLSCSVFSFSFFPFLFFLSIIRTSFVFKKIFLKNWKMRTRLWKKIFLLICHKGFSACECAGYELSFHLILEHA